jgi:urea transport system substrate-binding protein
MNDRHTTSSTTSFRSFLGKMALLTALVVLAALPFGLAGCKTEKPNVGVDNNTETVKVGILHSKTGTMAISETSLIDAELLAIEEINAAGGVLKKKIVPVVEDPESKFTTVFPEKAKKLLLQDKVAVVFGCWTSVSRVNVKPVFEEHNGLLFYPVQYEGNESSKNIVYTGAAPNQQIIPAVEWLLSKEGGAKKKFYLIGSNYVFPRTANFIITKYLKTKDLVPVDEKYTELGETEYNQVVQKIKAAEPDVIFSTINGDSNINFYKELAAAGITADKIPVVAVSVGEDELRGLPPATVKGHLAAWNYFQSLDTPANKDFVKKFKAKYGSDRVTDDPIAAAYAQVYYWKIAVEKAGSFDVDKVRAKLGEVEFDAPEGKVKVSGKNFHCYKSFMMGKIREDKQFDIIYKTDPIEPDPYPQIAFPGWSVDWSGKGLIKGDPVKIGR